MPGASTISSKLLYRLTNSANGNPPVLVVGVLIGGVLVDAGWLVLEIDAEGVDDCVVGVLGTAAVVAVVVSRQAETVIEATTNAAPTTSMTITCLTVLPH